MNELRVGSIVHYQDEGVPRAAVVTQLGGIGENPFVVGLCILNPTEVFFNTSVPYSEIPLAGHWSFPA